MRSKIALICVILATGCSAPRALTVHERAQLEPIKCAGKAECDVYWQRAQVWVAKYSTWRIQTATDVLIQTYGPGDSNTELAYRIFREPTADGGFLISFWAGCGNIFGCNARPVDAIANLRSYLFNGI